MEIASVPPPDWDVNQPSPVLSSAFASASAELGYRTLYVSDALRGGRALVLVRRIPIPVLRGWTGRAVVYTGDVHPMFLGRLLQWLAAARVSYVRVGDAFWGSPTPFEVPYARVHPEVRYLLVHTPARNAAAALAGMHRDARARIRKNERLGVTVTEIHDETELREYCALAEETAARMRSCHLAAVYPAEFFRAVFREMVPRRQAMFLLAQWEGRPLAGALYLISSTRLGQCHGASTRDRMRTCGEGPSAVTWYAMEWARTRGLEFDMGVTTPTADPTHPHFSVFRFKQSFGGTLREVHGAEVIISVGKCRFQQTVLRPLWDRLHPVYLRLFAGTTEQRGVVSPFSQP